MIITSASDDLKLITCSMLTHQSDTDEPARLCLQSVRYANTVFLYH